jgi:hypothetical protein
MGRADGESGWAETCFEEVLKLLFFSRCGILLSIVFWLQEVDL